MKKLKGKIIVLTGASSGIGEALACELAEHKPVLILAARRKNKLDELAARLKPLAGVVMTVECDISDPRQARALIEKTLSTYDRIDVLINNAGILIKNSLFDASAEEIQQQMKTNCMGPVTTIQAALPAMRRQHRGSIVNLSSAIGKRSVSRLGAYCASKFALEAFSDALRIEEKPNGIHVLTVRPDLTDTPMAQFSKTRRRRLQTT